MQSAYAMIVNMQLKEHEIRQLIIDQCNQTSQTSVAKRFGVTRAYMSDIVNDKRRISDAIADKLGYKMIELADRVYIPKKD